MTHSGCGRLGLAELTDYAAGAHGEIIYVEPAAWVRKLPIVEVEILLTAHDGAQDRSITRYTLSHGGSLHR